LGNEDLNQENYEKYIDARGAIGRMPEMHIRELFFHVPLRIYQEYTLHPLLERCP
jgi:hypothetical protein